MTYAYRLPSASHLELAEHCVFPWNSGRSWPEREAETAAQRFGHAFHALAEHLAKGSLVTLDEIADAHHLTDSERKRLEAMTLRISEVLEQDSATMVGAEVGVGYSLATGVARLVGDRHDTQPGELRGWADLVFERGDGMLVVRDWKTGMRARTKRAGDTKQLRFLAMVLGHLYERSVVRVELAFVDDGEVVVVGDDLDVAELGAAEGELYEIEGKLLTPPAPNPGPWCERYYCPMRSTCPATVAALAHVEADLDRFPMLGELTSAEQVAHIRHRLPVLRALLDQRETELEKWVTTHGPAPVEDRPGYAWGAVEHDGVERLTATPQALDIVRSRLGAPGASAAIEQTMTKTSLERGVKADLAAKGLTKRGALGAALVPLLEELRAAGALKKGGRHTRFEEFKRYEPETTEPGDQE